MDRTTKIIKILDELEDKIDKHFPKKIGFSNSKVYICPFGSWYLGLMKKDSDVDACVSIPGFALHPTYQTLTHYKMMEEVSSVLREIKNIHHIIDVFDASNPIIKFLYDDVKFDFCVAVIPVDRILVKEHIYNLKCSLRFDDKSYLSILGPRDWFYLKRIIEHRSCKIPLNIIIDFNNVIIQWAKNRLIYSGVLGYFCGYALRVLIFYIIKVYGKQESIKTHQLVSKFFTEFYNFDWENEAVSVTRQYVNILSRYRSTENNKRFINNPYTLFILTPTNKQTLRNMTRSTYYSIYEEMERSNKIVTEKKLFEMDFQNDSEEIEKIIENMLEDKKFFDKWDMVISMTVTQPNLSDWVGFIESRVVNLLLGFESMNENLDCLIYPYRFRLKSDKKSNLRYFFIGIKIFDEKKKLSLFKSKPKFSQFETSIREYSLEMKKWKFWKKGMDILFRPILPNGNSKNVSNSEWIFNHFEKLPK